MAGFVLQSILTDDESSFVLESNLTEVPTDLEVDYDIDSGNIDPTEITLSDAGTSTPTLGVKPRLTSGTGWDGHVHWFFALNGAEGRQPTITVDNTERRLSTTMSASWRPLYSYDLETWTPASSFTALTSPPRLQFQFPSPFTQNRVYIADHPVFTQQHAEDFAAELIADTSGFVSVSAEADGSGVLGLSPAEDNDLGTPVGGNPIFGFILADMSTPTTDGGVKRDLVVDSGMHAGEVVDGWPLRAMARWFISDMSAEAVAFRANWRLLLYFNMNPNGRKGGSGRGVWRTGEDPNRDWAGVGAWSLAENIYVRDGILADVVNYTAHICLHAVADSTSFPHGYYRDDVEDALNDEFKVFFDIRDPGTLAYEVSTAEDTVGEWAAAQGAKFVLVSEPGSRLNQTVARHEEAGVHYLEALTDLDADGWFYDSVGLEVQSLYKIAGLANKDVQLQYKIIDYIRRRRLLLGA